MSLEQSYLPTSILEVFPNQLVLVCWISATSITLKDFINDTGENLKPQTQSLNHLRKEGNVLFNDALNIFCLRLYSIGHMVKDLSDSERGNLLPPHGLLFY